MIPGYILPDIDPPFSRLRRVVRLILPLTRKGPDTEIVLATNIEDQFTKPTLSFFNRTQSLS